MRLRKHLIIGGIAAAALYHYLGPWRAILFLVAAVLIDADHYWDYLWRSKFRDWSAKRMFRYDELITERVHNRNFLGFSLLHTAEMFLLVYMLAHFWNYAFFITILWAMAFHLVLDMIYLLRKKAFFVRAYSIVEYWIRKKSMIHHGLDPDEFYEEMFELSRASKN